VYSTWSDCEARVKGFQGAVFKGFATRQEAEAFLGGSSTQGSASVSIPVAKKYKFAASSSAAASASAPASTSAAAKPNAFTAMTSAAAKPNAFTAMMSGASQKKSGVEANEIAIFTDGACAGNKNVAVSACPAGWGAIVVEGCLGDPPSGGVTLAELYGPVDLDAASPHYLGAEVGSNNTGELSAVCEALRWLCEHETSARAAVICYDSEYASNQAQGIHKAHKNVALAKRSHALLAQARTKRPVRFLHVKGHSGHKWNDAADSAANRGATGARSSASGAQRPPAPQHSDGGVSVASRKRPIDTE
jgi:ribonuclease HI